VPPPAGVTGWVPAFPPQAADRKIAPTALKTWIRRIIFSFDL
jgi:hypothetical protein